MKKTTVLAVALLMVSVGFLCGCNEKTGINFENEPDFQYDGKDYNGYYNFTGNITTCYRCEGSGKCRNWIPPLYYDDYDLGKILIRDGYWEDCYGDCNSCDGVGHFKEIIYLEITNENCDYNVGEVRILYKEW